VSLRHVQFTNIGELADEVWNDVAWQLKTAVSGGEFIGGAAVDIFEADWARYCGVSHAVGVGNGTDALHLTLRALGIGAGDEVVVPAMTFVATAEAVVLAGAAPRFADVDPDTLLITADSVAAAITSRTKAIVVVHLYGQPPNMDELGRLAGRYGLFLIEDAAQAHGAHWRDRPVGSLSDAACFSFYPSKNLGAFGDAGAVVTDDAGLAERVRSLANHGRPNGSHHQHLSVGTTSRLDALQAIVLRSKLDRLDGWTRARQHLAARYRFGLRDTPGIRLLAQHQLADHVFHLFVVRVPERDVVRAEFARRGIETGVHYALPCHRQPAYAPFTNGALPNSEAAATEVLSLPLYPHMSTTQVDWVVEETKSILADRVRAGAEVA
jgi:dTDP-4-amino-4,6-dideoxygalactose transaminase